MIKFFRKIRFDLMNKNKTGKYLKYAIGEILLVVIGILIALQVNNWNIERKSELKARDLSENLLEELRGVKHLMDNQLEAMDKQKTFIQYVINNNEFRMDSVLSLTKMGNFNVDPLNFLSSYTVYFNPRRDAYNSAINEGTLELIESKDIIRLLSSAYTLGEKRSAEHVEAEILINTKIQEHISDEYQDIFKSGELIYNNGAWDKTTTNKILKEINMDGKLKYLLSAKLQILRFKHATLNHSVYPKVEWLIEYFESNQN